MNLFLDTEFTGLTQKTNLISLAIVAENGAEFYAEFTDFQLSSNKFDEFIWINDNVIANLFLDDRSQSFELSKMHLKGSKSEVKSALVIWLNQFGIIKNEKGEVEQNLFFWADVPHYDWVLFCELFGGARNIPQQIHYMCLDLATLLYAKGEDYNKTRTQILEEVKLKLPEGYAQHNALSDARLCKMIFESFN